MIGDGDCGEIGVMKIVQGTPKFSEKTYPSATFVHHKSHMTRLGFELGPPRWEAWDYFFF
jgi:hypothetical protein